jgi:hypothetical protein
MDGISAVTARIGEIRALLHPAPAAPARAAAAVPSGFPSAGGAGASTAGPSFADALARAGAPAVSEPLSVAALHAKYQNGRVPADALAPVGDGGHRLAAPAAAAYDRLQAAARRDGVTIGVTDSYRSFDAQVDVARRKGLYPQGGLAAQPGTSQHGWGLAVDLDLDSRAQAWMRANGPRFGFVEDTPREPWHWAYKA